MQQTESIPQPTTCDELRMINLHSHTTVPYRVKGLKWIFLKNTNTNCDSTFSYTFAFLVVMRSIPGFRTLDSKKKLLEYLTLHVLVYFQGDFSNVGK